MSGDDDDNFGAIGRSVVPRNTVQVRPVSISRDRFTVVETIAFNSQGGSRVAPVESKYFRELSSQEDRPYQRTYKVSEEPKPLDLGWAGEWAEIGLLHVSNDEGKHTPYIPTPKEKQETAKRIVELGDWLILPGESMRGLPKVIKDLKVRCQSGTAKITVTIYPA